jgi:hypothetical protein
MDLDVTFYMPVFADEATRAVAPGGLAELCNYGSTVVDLFEAF